jgi:hypothetical protein
VQDPQGQKRPWQRQQQRQPLAGVGEVSEGQSRTVGKQTQDTCTHVGTDMQTWGPVHEELEKRRSLSLIFFILRSDEPALAT